MYFTKVIVKNDLKARGLGGLRRLGRFFERH